MISPLRPDRAGRSIQPRATLTTAKPDRFRTGGFYPCRRKMRRPSGAAGVGFIPALFAFLVTPGPQAAGEARLAKQAEAFKTDETFDEVLSRFIDRHCKPNLRTCSEVERILRKDASPAFGKMPIKDITKRHIGELLDAVIDRGAPRTAGALQNHLYNLFRWSVGRGYLERNPSADMPKVGASIKRDRVLTDDEIRLVWKATDILGWPYQTIFRLLLLTGQRKSEIAKGFWCEVDLEAKVWRLPAVRVKNKSAHTFPLSAEAIELLQGTPRIDGTDLMFTIGGKSPATGWDYVKDKLDSRIAELNGGEPIPDWRIHDLRRTAATGMASIGIPPHVIEAVINHLSGSKSGVAGIYNRHGYEAEMRTALDAWARRLNEIITGAKADNVLTLIRH